MIRIPELKDEFGRDLFKHNRDNPHYFVIKFGWYWGICLGPKEILNPEDTVYPEVKGESLGMYHDRVLDMIFI